MQIALRKICRLTPLKVFQILRSAIFSIFAPNSRQAIAGDCPMHKLWPRAGRGSRRIIRFADRSLGREYFRFMEIYHKGESSAGIQDTKKDRLTICVYLYVVARSADLATIYSVLTGGAGTIAVCRELQKTEAVVSHPNGCIKVARV